MTAPWMFDVELALRSASRDKAMIGLMVLALAVGASTFVAFMSLLGLLSGNPLGASAQQIHLVQIDFRLIGRDRAPVPLTLPYQDVVAISRYSGGRFIPVAAALASLRGEAGAYEIHDALMTRRTFFEAFAVPFLYGSAWPDDADVRRERVAVISSSLNERLFHGGNSVGSFLDTKAGRLRIVGVLASWRPMPKFYNLSSPRRFEAIEDVFMPLSTGMDLAIPLNTGFECPTGLPDLAHLDTSECSWISLWAQIKEADANTFGTYVRDYASHQHEYDRGVRGADVHTWNVIELMHELRIVPSSVYAQAMAASGFLLVCLCNCMALLLAKFKRREGTLVLLRAIGASRLRIVRLLVMEGASIGLAGGLIGLCTGWLCVVALHGQGHDFSSAIHFEWPAAIGTVVVALVGAITAAIGPALVVARVEPADQLKDV